MDPVWKYIDRDDWKSVVCGSIEGNFSHSGGILKGGLLGYWFLCLFFQKKEPNKKHADYQNIFITHLVVLLCDLRPILLCHIQWINFIFYINLFFGYKYIATLLMA